MPGGLVIAPLFRAFQHSITGLDFSSPNFSPMNEVQNDRDTNCPFCTLSSDAIIVENDLAFAINDRYPVTSGHMLVIPKRHAADYFDLTPDELDACNSLLRKVKNDIQTTDSSVTGFNIGVNIGRSAGQTIFHCHLHLIPRRDGDTENPRGGVRGVIPGRQRY